MPSVKPFGTSQGVKFIRINSLLKLRAAQNGSEGDTVLFFHSPPPSVTHFLLPLHNQTNLTSSLVVQCSFGCVAWSFRDVPDLHHAYSIQVIAWSIGAC